MNSFTSPTVFISYSHDSPAHVDRVLAFSNRLLDDGIDVVLDQYHPHPFEGWPLWMDKHIRDADFVLMVCTESYYKRVMNEEEPGRGQGVRWEGSLIYNHIYDARSINTHFIPVLFTDMKTEYIPTPVKGVTCYVVDSQDGYEYLYRRLTNQPKAIKPELGKLKAMPPRERQTNFFPFWNVPYPRNLYFTGRREELSRLRDGLAAKKTQVVSGLGGMGKTQTAVEYAFLYQSEYHAILWVNAENNESLTSGFAALAAVLDLPEKDATDHSLALAATKRWLASHDGWLLILDNADVPGIIAGFLPEYLKGHLLLTSRAQVFDVLGIAEPVPLNEMSPDEAQTFLLMRTARKDISQEENEALRELVKKLDGLPLALEQAGAYLAAMKSSFQDYLAGYRTRGLKLLEKKQPVTGRYLKSVATTWVLNFAEVEKISPAAADLLRACTFLHPEEIPFELFIFGASALGPQLAKVLAADDPLVLDEVMEPLTRYSLIRKDVATRTFDMHRLVQVVMREIMDDKTQRMWAKRVVHATNLAFPSPEFSNWPLCERLLPHAKTCFEQINTWEFTSRDVSRLLNDTGLYLHYRALYAGAEQFIRRALEIDENNLGKDHPSVSICLNNLALLLQAMNRLEEAEPLMRRSLEIDEKSYGKDHPIVAIRLNNLVSLLQETNRLKEAEQFMRRVLEIDEKNYCKDHPSVAISLNNLAVLLKTTNRIDEAEPLMRRALEIDEKSYGTEHPSVAIRLNNLATLLKAESRFTESESLLHRALELDIKIYGTNHPHVARDLNNLATLFKVTNRLPEAESLMRRALEIDEKSYGYEHPKVAIRLNNLASLLKATNRLAEAEHLMRDALEIDEKSYGKDHPTVAIRLNNLALLLKDTNRLTEAEQLSRHHLEILFQFTQSTGHPHPHLKAAISNYKGLLKEMGYNGEKIMETLWKLFPGFFTK